jgi:hypothetical protein
VFPYRRGGPKTTKESAMTELPQPANRDEYLATIAAADTMLVTLQHHLGTLVRDLRAARVEESKASYVWSATHKAQSHVDLIHEMSATQAAVRDGRLPSNEPEYHPMSRRDAEGHYARTTAANGGADAFARARVRNPNNIPPNVRSSHIQQPKSERGVIPPLHPRGTPVIRGQ